MSTKLFRILAALCGIVGPIILVGSFIMNPAPPADYTVAQLRDFAIQHHNEIVLGGWLQGIGSLLLVLFAIALVHLADATQRFAGWITQLSGAAILMVSLMEVTFYLATVQATELGDTASALSSANLIKAVQHVFLIAPALLLPLGFVLLGSNVLPRGFAYLALVMGATLQIFGLLGLFNVLQPVIDTLVGVQSLWFVAAAIALAIHAERPALSRVKLSHQNGVNYD